jgi:hypothetical protein
LLGGSITRSGINYVSPTLDSDRTTLKALESENLAERRLEHVAGGTNIIRIEGVDWTSTGTSVKDVGEAISRGIIRSICQH